MDFSVHVSNFILQSTKYLIEIYSYINTIHLEAEVRKGLDYDLTIGELAYRRTEGLSMKLNRSISDGKLFS